MDESANFVSLGVGSSPILYKELSVERLVSALQVAVSDEAMRSRAIALFSFGYGGLTLSVAIAVGIIHTVEEIVRVKSHVVHLCGGTSA
ncbi:hypothetical protein [Coleofasciculus sp.]|uniref:hypothetical protein n=1 Tax=Coleofasciculus sp. TaxID=3100458 RepID=UPI0039F8A06D